jgi:ribosome-associated translation inhibitor RaiA
MKGRVADCRVSTHRSDGVTITDCSCSRGETQFVRARDSDLLAPERRDIEMRRLTVRILVNSDHNVRSDAEVSERVESIVSGSIDRFAARITRVEVHLKDLNGAKGGADDKRCTIEARIAGLADVAVSHDAPTLRDAIDGAADKLERALEHRFGRVEAGDGRTTRDGEIASPDFLDKARQH